MQARDFSDDAVGLGVFRVKSRVRHQAPRERGEAGHREAVEARERRVRWSGVCGGVLDVGTAPDGGHFGEDRKGEFGVGMLAGFFGEVLDGCDYGFEYCLVGGAHEHRFEVVAEQDEQEPEVLAAELTKLDLVVCASRLLREAAEYALQEGREEGVEDVEDLRFEAENDLVEEAEEGGHFVAGRGFGQEAVDPLGELLQDLEAEHADHAGEGEARGRPDEHGTFQGSEGNQNDI